MIYGKNNIKYLTVPKQGNNTRLILIYILIDILPVTGIEIFKY